MSLNIAKSNKKRVVIVGGGFGGLKLANKLKKSGFQVVLIDKNNYHQFPPLIYQVASAGMEPTSISFPFRKIFQHRKDFYFRMAEVRAIFPEKNMIQTSIGKAEYDYLVLAAGTTTNYFGNKHIEEEAMPMKNVSEAMGLRNALLANLERALTCSTKQEQQELLNIVIVGGGATSASAASVPLKALPARAATPPRAKPSAFRRFASRSSSPARTSGKSSTSTRASRTRNDGRALQAFRLS